MTAKITISMPDNLKRMIDDYNKRHPFEPLIISQLAQKAVFEKIKAEDPELVSTLEKKEQVLKQIKERPPTLRNLALKAAYGLPLYEEPQVTRHDKGYPEIKSREILLEEELTQPSQEESQTTDKQMKKQHIVVCAECGKFFTAERKTRKFCSGKCKTAYGRKSKK